MRAHSYRPTSRRPAQLFDRRLGYGLVQALLACLLAAVLLPSPAMANDPVVRLDTTKGPIFIRVFRSLTPVTAGNFLDLVSRGFYNGKIFHRIESWCIQGGDPNGNGTGNFVDPATGQVRHIPLEINRSLAHNAPGVVAMARSKNPNSASCQFYITKTAMRQLDGQYAIFGRVVGGLDTVFAIRRGDTITSARVLPDHPPSASGSSPSRGSDSGKGSSQGPYEPPSEIPDAGF